MEASHPILQLVERAALGIELLAVAIIVLVIATATTRYVIVYASRRASTATYKDYRARVARALLLGLQILSRDDLRHRGARTVDDERRDLGTRSSIRDALELGRWWCDRGPWPW